MSVQEHDEGLQEKAPQFIDIAREDGTALRIAEIRLRERQVLASDALLYIDSESELFVPFALIMDELGFQISADDSGFVSGWFLRETQRVTIDPALSTVEIAGTAQPLGRRQLVLLDGQLHISRSALDEWFLLSSEWDETRQVLSLTPPYLLASEEAARRRRGMGGAAGSLSIDTTGFAVISGRYSWLEWPYAQVNLAVTADSSPGRIAGQASLLAEGDILQATGRLALTADTNGLLSARFTLGRRDPLARQLGPLRASIVEAGDIAAPGTPLLQRNAFGVGLRIGREPLDRGGNFDTSDLVGDAPPGWQAELYRDEELLGFQTISGDGRYNFREIPTQFGVNRFRVQLYGPSGEQQTIERAIDIAASLVRPGVLRYNFLFLREGYSLVEGRQNNQFASEGADDLTFDNASTDPAFFPFNSEATYLEARASYGLSGSLGINAIAAWRSRDDVGQDTANLGAGFNLRTAGILWGGDALMQQNGEFAARGQVGFALGRLSLSASHEEYSNGFRSGENDFGILQIISRSQLSVSGQIGGIGAGLSADRSVQLNGDTDQRLLLRLSGNLSGISLSSRLAYRDNSRLVGNTQNSEAERADGSLIAAGSLGSFRLRGGFAYEILPAISARRAIGEVSYRASDWFLALRAERDLRDGDGQWSLAANRDLNGIRFGADVRFDERSRNLRGFLTVALTIDRDPLSGGVRFGRHALSNRGTLVASAFLDRNANNQRDEGEEIIRGVDVELEPRGLTTRGDDGVLIQNLPVDREIAVVPDLDNIDDPYLAVREDGYLISMRPGATFRLDLPVVESGEIVATVASSEGEPASGEILTLVSCSGDTEPARERTAFDGQAFFIGLIPGCYRIDSGSIERQIDVIAGEVVEMQITLP